MPGLEETWKYCRQVAETVNSAVVRVLPDAVRCGHCGSSLTRTGIHYDYEKKRQVKSCPASR